MQKISTLTRPHSLITDFDIFLFKEGTHFRLFDKLGSHPLCIDGVHGTHFAVWAPNAKSVSVIGDFNDWNPQTHKLFCRWDHSGIWEGFIPHVGHGALYKYHLISHTQSHYEKGDPFAFYWEIPPKTASIVWDLQYAWHATDWDKSKKTKNTLNSPMSIYELHFGSWRHKSFKESLSYREMASVLPKYLQNMGFTHVEFMPIMEHPFYGSWGYQKSGYFAPSSRYGTPQDLMYLIDCLHEHGIGVFFDWVPSHFPSDPHALAAFDGTALFEHEDPKQGFHPDWKSLIFNYSRHEVRSFLISSALFWLDKYNIDGLRVDAVSSMLYLDYSRKQNEWIPNKHGGHENLEAIDFLKLLNEKVYKHFPYAQMIAEESTAWPMVSRPTVCGGLGFGLKWNMGWMHDTLDYFSKDPLYRKHHHNNLLFNMYYFFNENFVLSISHDEVVYGKRSLLGKMPGDDWQKFANLRLLYSYMYAHPGKKLLFMGSELASLEEWNHDLSLPWELLSYPQHQGIQKLLQTLNHLYQNEPALYARDFDHEAFQWISLHDAALSIIAFARKTPHKKGSIFIVCNFTPIPRHHYSLEFPFNGVWQEVFNSNLSIYGGNDHNAKESTIFTLNHLIKEYSLPPLGALFFKYLE